MKGVTPDGHFIYNLANISYTGILSVNLGVHIGVISPDIQYNSVTLDQISPNPYHNYQENLFLIFIAESDSY